MKIFKYLLIIVIMTGLSVCYAQLERKEIFKSTQVTQALKRSLDTDGTWRTIHYKEIGTPSTPPPEGTHYTYYKADGNLYSMDSTGTETVIGNANGDVAGPATSTDNAVPRFDGTDGNLLKDSSVIVNDNGDIETPGTLETSSENIDTTVWEPVGDGNFGDLVNPNVIRLTSSRIVFSDNNTNTITVANFDGLDWTLSAFHGVENMGRPAAAPLTPNSFAFIDDFNQVLQKYEFDGTISTVGNPLDLSTITAKPIMTALTENRIAFVEGSHILRVYDFDGTDWAQVGNDFDVIGSGFTSMSALGTNRIAYFDTENDFLYTYDFDGTTWTQVGNSLSIAWGAIGMASLSTSEIVVANQAGNLASKMSFDGTDWIEIDSFNISSLQLPSVAVLDTNRFVVARETTSPTVGLRTWQFAKPVNTVLDEDQRQLSGTSESGFRRVDRMEIDKSLYIGIDPTGLPSLMVKGKSQFGNTVDVLKDIRFPDGSEQASGEADNLIIVREPSDFGTLSGGLYQLEDGKVYEIRVPLLTLENGLEFSTDGDVEIRGTSLFGTTIVFTPTVAQALFKHNSGNRTGNAGINDVSIVLTNTDATAYDITGLFTFFEQNVFIVANDVGKLGKFTDISSISLQFVSYIDFTEGMTLENCTGAIDTVRNIQTTDSHTDTPYWTITGDEAFTLGFSMGLGVPFATEAYVNIVSIHDDAAIAFSKIQFLDSGNFFGTGFNQFDPRVSAEGLFNIIDSTICIQGFLDLNTSVTTIFVQDGWSLINTGIIDWTYEGGNRMLGDTLGRVEVESREPASIAFDANIKMEPDTGASQSLAARFVKFDVEDRTVTFNNGTNRVIEVDSPRVNGDTISFIKSDGTLPTGLFEDPIYYVIDRAGSSFEISYTEGGSTVTFTTDGTGTNSYSVATLIGSSAERDLSPSNAGEVTPQAETLVVTGDSIAVVVSNRSTVNDIEVKKGYMRMRK